MRNLALKYRPLLLEDVVGQPIVVQTLSNAVKNNKLRHGYLLVGQIGSGKTTVARILAAMENCTDSPGLHPCGKCSVCKGIFEGSHTDIREVDAASSAGSAEEIRKLKADAAYNPIDGAKTKIFIIDEVHRSSPTANDALLKILEEPPSHVRFILCTTDVQKVRPAIQSRCQRHDFGKIYWSLISERIADIARQEKVEVEPAALNLCARLASGSMRNGIYNLEKLIDFADKDAITIADAQIMFGKVGENLYYNLIDQIIGTKSGKPDASEGFRIINNMLATGTDFDVLYVDILEHLRSIMVGLTCMKAGEFLQVSEEGKRRLKEQLAYCKEHDKLSAVIDIIGKLRHTKREVELNYPPDISLQKWLLESIFAFRR